ncbi:transglycosylase SLT domain-containing protein [Kribbella sp. NBC_01484]|uniref:transglycosylase SLT domain-containing protein n=1 Tax=Kribbella sp. NBC_01484 TaxID=2903579 RepID=UPI002E35DCC9|nr:transglycosylase SLT domain-containing protein [Kribbella sp. NBC_01484]
MAKRWWWVAVGVVIVGVWAVRHDGDRKTAETAETATAQPTPSATPQRTVSPTPAAKPWYDDYDPAHFAPQVRRYAGQAGIRPQLLMAILYNEAYKPHDPKFERSWAQVDSDPAFGIANMHRAAFDDTKRGRDFAGRKWEQLPDDPGLAIEAAAWHLHDLAKRLPDKRSQRYTKDELLALGYNTGAGNMRAFAKGAKAGAQAQSYLDRLHDSWDKSARAVG